MDRGAWRATVHRVTEADTTEQAHTIYINIHIYIYLYIFFGEILFGSIHSSLITRYLILCELSPGHLERVGLLSLLCYLHEMLILSFK